ncbi:MAG: hypothetical protein IK076_07530 [Bacteroidales bacterium]|nr:hypothetical protein [Bacteroidales bacterium]
MSEVALLITIQDGGDRGPGCMEECQKQVDAIAAEGKYSFSIFLNNEGQEGSLSVREKASKEGADLYIWIDYDLHLREDALRCLLENSEFLRHKAVIAGSVSGPDKTLLSGGRNRRGHLIDPDPTIPIPCQLYDMSLVLVPEYVFSSLESPADFFRRGFLDNGFGSRVAKADVARMVAPGVLATTERQPARPDWRNTDLPFRDRAEAFFRSVILNLK